MSGLSRTPGKRVRVHSPPRVRIPPSPPATPGNKAIQAHTARLPAIEPPISETLLFVVSRRANAAEYCSSP
jgi:hypothetical protein